MGCGNGLLGFGDFGGILGGACGGGCGGCGGWGGRGCGCDNDRSIRVITAVRAVCARGDGCFDGRW